MTAWRVYFFSNLRTRDLSKLASFLIHKGVYEGGLIDPDCWFFDFASVPFCGYQRQSSSCEELKSAFQRLCDLIEVPSAAIPFEAWVGTQQILDIAMAVESCQMHR